MVNASVILAELAHGAVNEVFRNHRLAFRAARAKDLEAARVCSVALKGADATGSLHFFMEEAVLSAMSVARERRQDLVNELTNMIAGHLETELLRRGVAIQYSPPRAGVPKPLESYARGSDGLHCSFEERIGRVGLTIELNLAASVVLGVAPTRQAPERSPARMNLPPGTAKVSGSVLVVDDSVNARASVLTALTGAGFEVLQADSGLAALQMIEERKDIRLVFTDLHMAGIRGTELIKKIKADPKLSGLPVVVLTASPAAVAEVDPKHIVTCLIKPISPAAVIAIAQRILQPVGSARSLAGD